MNVIKHKKKKKVQQKKTALGLQASPSPAKFRFSSESAKLYDDKIPPLYRTSNKYDLLDEIERQIKDNNDEEGFTISTDLLFEAWKKFRPINKIADDEKMNSRKKKIRTKMHDIREIWP